MKRLPPQIELQVDDLPWPVTPIKIRTFDHLNSLPALTTASNSFSRTTQGTIMNSFNEVKEELLPSKLASNACYAAGIPIRATVEKLLVLVDVLVSELESK